MTDYINLWGLPFGIRVRGSKYRRFKAFRTIENGSEQFKEIGIFEVDNGVLIYDPLKGSVTTFVGIE